MPDDRANSPPAAVEPGTTIGRYRVANVIADGPSGTLYEAVEAASGRRVALRRLPDRYAHDSAAAEQFLKAAGKGLQHRNIVAVEAIERHNGDAFLVMEFVGGRSAGAGGGRVPWRVASRIVRDAAHGLAAIHNAGLVHGEVRPGHIIVGHDGTTKLADLGLAGLDETPVNPACAAPELIRGHPADARTDLYALGATYFTLLTGRAPFADAGNPLDIYDAILHRPLPPTRATAPDVPLRCEAIVQKAMAKDPSARYASADEMITDLDAVLAADEPSRPMPLPKLPRPPRFWHRPESWVGGLIVLIALAAGAWYVFGPKPPPPAAPKRPPEFTQPALINSIGMPLMRAPAGPFFMGDSSIANARPRHPVQISRPFLIGAHEVTQTEYQLVMGANPSQSLSTGEKPVDSVTWDEAVAFCEKLSAREAERTAGRVYRLPTEAEWEYACRAGTTTPYSLGTELHEKANTLRAGLNMTMPVGSFPANPWGLYDVHGNVAEWCGDWYSADYYAGGKLIDPTGPREGSRRVVRGGSWQSEPEDCRSASRDGLAPGTSSPAVGFRVVCTVQGEK